MTIEIPVALYRFYDSADVLLYVGITENLGTRIQGHASSQHWWGDASRLTVEMLPNRDAAEAAETAAIRTELPVYNRAKTSPERRAQLNSKGKSYEVQRIAAELRADIMEGRIADGSRMPSVSSFAKARGLTSSTVNCVWRILKKEGYLAGRQGASVHARNQFISESTSDDVFQLLDVVEVEPPARLAESLGEDRVILRRHLRLRDGMPIELGNVYYPARMAAELAPKRHEPAGEPHKLLAELGYPVRTFADRLAFRPPTTEEVEILDMPSSASVIHQTRTALGDNRSPLAVLELVKPGHLHQLTYDKVTSSPARC